MFLYAFNSNRMQRVASCQVKILASNFLINVPTGYQRFTSLGEIKFLPNNFILSTRGDLDCLDGLKGAMNTISNIPMCENVKVVLQNRLLDYFNASCSYLGRRYFDYSFMGLGGVNANNRFQPGFNSSTSQHFKNMRYVQEVLDSMKELPDEVKAQMNNFNPFLKTRSDLFDPEFLASENLVSLSNDHFEVYIMRHADLETNDFRTAYFFVWKLQPFRFNKAKLSQYKIETEEMITISNGGKILREGIELTKFDFIEDHKMKGLIVADLSPGSSESFLGSSFLKKFLDHPKIQIKLLAHLGSKEVFSDQNVCFALKELNVLQTFLHADFDSNLVSCPLKSHYGVRNSTFSSEFPFLFPTIPSSLAQSPLPFEGLAFETFKRIKLDGKETVAEDLTSVEPRLNKIAVTKAKIKKAAENDPFKDFHQAQNRLFDFLSDDSAKFEPFVVCLGTGSKNVSVIRSDSSYLVGISKDALALFDCGQGTLFQLQQQFGDKIDEVLRKIRIVMISHFHGDHHLGSTGIFKERQRVMEKNGLDETLFVILPRNCMQMFNAYLKLEPKSFIQFIPSDVLRNEVLRVSPQPESKSDAFCKIDLSNSSKNLRSFDFEFLKSFLPFCLSQGINSILPTPVNHCRDSMGFVLDFGDRRVVYSGDCLPTPLLAKEGRQADLLIHECTFDCSYSLKELEKKKHSNVEQAVEIGMMMDAKRVLLTHFSQRLNPWLWDEETDFFTSPKEEVDKFFKEKCFVALDHLTVAIDAPVEILSRSVALMGGYSFKKYDFQVVNTEG